MPQCNETEINTPPDSKFIADQNGTFIFSGGNFSVQFYLYTTCMSTTLILW